MQKLIQGIHHFQSTLFSPQRELFERLAVGQHPDALFITCSDSRINPNLITHTEPGDLFILRTRATSSRRTGLPTVGRGRPSSSPWRGWAFRTSSSAATPTAAP